MTSLLKKIMLIVSCMLLTSCYDTTSNDGRDAFAVGSQRAYPSAVGDLVAVSGPTLDIDGNGKADALTDGLLVLRYLFGFRGGTLVNGAIGTGASITAPADIEFALSAATTDMLDVDGNGQADALTDGLVILRYLFGFRGDTLVNGTVGVGATRVSATDIETYLVSIVPEQTVDVRLSTNYGNITLRLYPERAPLTVANFLDYVNAGFYTNTIFHRVIDGFVIQGGGAGTDYYWKTPLFPPIPNESDNGESNLTGTIAMARTTDPHSATSQFYINVADNTNLDFKPPSTWGYAVFGKVIEGMDVVNTIKAIPTYTNDVPIYMVVITAAEVL